MNESDMTVLGDPRAGDRSGYRVLPGFGGTALFDADFHSFSFAPHFHDTLMIGLILEGEKRFSRGRSWHRVTRGGLSVVNPGDMHTGGVAVRGQRLRYRAVYPGPALLAESGLPPGADFGAAVVDDRTLEGHFARALDPDGSAAEAEEALLIALTDLGRRHGTGEARWSSASCGRSVSRAVDYIEAQLETSLRLEQIAAEAGIGPRHLLRGFRRTLGATPQQYVRQARVRRVCGLLRAGEGFAQAASAAGFADQAHMTRVFRSLLGMTPSAFLTAWRASLT
ncbi:AraC family transcriptional regulator [Algihabitans albus]|uniref:AraC family transcriptional regulator n=1 Tax=Algihabitans albus TaxID=2164067 RepID=UPI000E5C9D82|nr:AraC family transcriptional regulator [Algihabitans albus]